MLPPLKAQSTTDALNEMFDEVMDDTQEYEMENATNHNESDSDSDKHAVTVVDKDKSMRSVWREYSKTKSKMNRQQQLYNQLKNIYSNYIEENDSNPSNTYDLVNYIQYKNINGITHHDVAQFLIAYNDQFEKENNNNENSEKSRKKNIIAAKTVLMENRRSNAGSKLFKEHTKHSINCGQDQCDGIERISVLLKWYQRQINMETNQISMNKILNKFGKYYGLTEILNDYSHILKIHKQKELEKIYNSINIRCDIAKCQGIKRNQRERADDVIDIDVDNKSNDTETQQLLINDIMDTIHSTIIHTFDVGFALTQKEKSSLPQKQLDNDTDSDNDSLSIIDDVYIKMNKILNKKRENYRRVLSSLERIEHSKFVTEIENDQNNIDNKKDELDDQKGNSNDDTISYSFSYRFYYWDNCINNEVVPFQHPEYKISDLYVEAQFDNLKNEMYNNKIHTLQSINIWNQVNEKANSYLKIAAIKQLAARERTGYECDKIGIIEASTVAIQHLMVIIFYCDFSVLSYKFSQSFRKLSPTDNLEQLKRRHANYYWFARYLRELVEWYGNDIEHSQYKCYYHGISIPMSFSSTSAYMNHPCSTTLQLNVAANFATDKGMIIQLGTDSYGRWIFYFDCSIISAFSNEDEKLFFGGYRRIIFMDIIMLQTGNRFREYLNVLNIFMDAISGQNVLRGKEKKKYNEVVERIVQDDISKYDKYFQQIICSIKNNTRSIELNQFFLNGGSFSGYGYKYLKKYFLSPKLEGFPNLKFIASFFNGKCKTIVVKNGSRQCDSEPTSITKEYIALILQLISMSDSFRLFDSIIFRETSQVVTDFDIEKCKELNVELINDTTYVNNLIIRRVE